MIRRLFYFWLGFLTAVWAMRRIRALHPDHVARRAVTAAAGTGVALREFAADVRRLTASREIELRARYGLDTVEDRPMLEDRRPVPLRRTRALESGVPRHGTTNHIETHSETHIETHDEKDGR
ncbi:hypothetical protein AB0K60_32050 [Thermopolyspora sp. NPDC052614]|uniref:hypothetical protein n=1 Tax=Thermopolyspora sp. NPDC052614 TaxID=3155682 RepID=UPI0034150123